MDAPLTDTHAHLHGRDFDADRAEVLARARAGGVDRVVVVGTDVESSRAAFDLCRGEAGLYPTAGIHPHDASGSTEVARAAIRELCRAPECVGVGETGLDYFKEFSPRADQLANFAWHAALAREIGKPLVVHCRDAHADTAALLAEHRGVRGVMHCWTMGPDELAPYLDLGLFVSFSGVVTYPRNEAIREAARRVPADRLVVETDCPFLAPQGRRGKRNEPAHLVEVLRAVAAARGETQDELARTTSANAARLFGLPPPAR